MLLVVCNKEHVAGYWPYIMFILGKPSRRHYEKSVYKDNFNFDHFSLNTFSSDKDFSPYTFQEQLYAGHVAVTFILLEALVELSLYISKKRKRH